jgi:3-deoxy-alpha-D-manno-octulosonate 8-oxidase
MSGYKNLKQVGAVIFGRGALGQLDAILADNRQGAAPMVFLVDDVFRNQPEFLARLPVRGRDRIYFADVSHEPTTGDVDGLRDRVRAELGKVSGLVGIGGGSTMDLAKAVALMLTNPGSSQDYQGWDLVQVPGAYKVGVPTLSGTGAEVSRTAVLIGPTKKLGLNSDYTPFDQVVLDPDLIAGVPARQRFFTGMDCYIHNVESLQGRAMNAFARAHAEKSLQLCREIFLERPVWTRESDEKLMMASWLGGMSIAYSQVGAAHAMSYGLAYVLGTRHGEGNCIAMGVLDAYYAEGVREFRRMAEQAGVEVPRGITKDLPAARLDKMVEVSLGMAPLWQNALGDDWRREMTPERLRALYERL